LRSPLKTVLPLLVFTLSPILHAQDPVPPEPPKFDVKAHYTKYEYRIPMRDGVHLFTSVYVPKDSSRSYPFLIDRTPYNVGPYGVDQFKERLGPSPDFDQSGYIFVFQDVRGRWMSEGSFVEMRPHIDEKKSNKDVDDSTDLYDTIDWLLKNIPNNNGRAGIWGISYPGFFTSASIIDSHPALKAASPQAPMTNLFMGDDAYHGGAFMLDANFDFYTFFNPQDHPQLPPKTEVPFDFGTKDGYEFYLGIGPTANLSKFLKGKGLLWEDQEVHDTYDDYWKARNLAPHMKNIHCAVLTVGGWFDAEDLQGPFSTFHAIDQYNSGIFNALVVGPWVHGGWYRYDGNHLGSVSFASNTGEYYRKNILYPFFEQHLKGNGNAKLPKAYVFETGTNVWRQYSSWPPANATKQTLYFQPSGGFPSALLRRQRMTNTSAIPTNLFHSSPTPRSMFLRNIWWRTSVSRPLAPTCWSIKLRRLKKTSRLSGPFRHSCLSQPAAPIPISM
jgi:putative CocE/NonD family hydrolase